MNIGGGSFGSLLWGPGSSFHVSAVSGFDDLPPLRSADMDRPMAHGAFPGTDYLAPRTVVMEFTLIADDNAGYLALVDQFRAAMMTTVVEQPMLIFGRNRQINCRVRKRAIPYNAGYLARTGLATVEFVATDPRIYDANLTAYAVALQSTSGGVTFNATFNDSFGVVGTGGSVIVQNTGTFSTPPLAVINGPVDQPVLENVAAGKALKFAITLGGGDTLTVDFGAHSILLNSTASRRSALTSDSQWWQLDPGYSQINFRAAAYQNAAFTNFSFRSAWI